MRIAISGSHRTGKTTLVDILAGSLRTFRVIDEPYHQLEDEGHAFADPPSLEDFELQLQRAIASIRESDGHCLFDRCPADVLAYLITHEASGGFDLDAWLPDVRDAMQQLDLVVFVPIEEPDRVVFSESDHVSQRRTVDDELHETLVRDPWEFGVCVLEVSGSPENRARQVLAYLADQAPQR